AKCGKTTDTQVRFQNRLQDYVGFGGMIIEPVVKRKSLGKCHLYSKTPHPRGCGLISYLYIGFPYSAFFSNRTVYISSCPSKEGARTILVPSSCLSVEGLSADFLNACLGLWLMLIPLLINHGLNPTKVY